MDLGAIKNQVSALSAGFAADAEDIARKAKEGESAEAAESFETLLATMLVKEMRSALPKGLFGDGPGADAYESWFDKNLGESLAKSDALGLSGMIKTSIDRAAANEELEQANTPAVETDQ